MKNAKKSNKSAILLHLDQDFIYTLNEIASIIGVSRADLIRRSLVRDVKFIIEVELPKLQSTYTHISHDYKKYIDKIEGNK
jgi:hypothetical protein